MFVLACIILPVAAHEPEVAAFQPLPTDSAGIIDLSPRQFDELVRSRSRARRLRMRAEERQYVATAPRHSLSLTYGVAPLINEGDYIPWCDLDRSNPAYELLHGKYTEDCFGRRSGGSLALVYTCRLSYRWEVGVSLAYIRYFDKLKMNEITFSRSLSEHQLCVMPLVRILWTNRPSLRLYSGMEFGMQAAFRRGFFDRKYDSAVHFACQLTLFGFQFGRRVFLSTEIGLGARGAVAVGIGCKIGCLLYTSPSPRDRG